MSSVPKKADKLNLDLDLDIWANAGLLLIGPLGTNFSEIWIKVLRFSLKKMYLKMSFAK